MELIMINGSVNPNESIRRRWYPLTWCCIKNRFEKWHSNSCEQDKKQPNSLMAMIWHIKVVVKYKYLKNITNFQCFIKIMLFYTGSHLCKPSKTQHYLWTSIYLQNKIASLYFFPWLLVICYLYYIVNMTEKIPTTVLFCLLCCWFWKKNIWKYIWQKRGILFYIQITFSIFFMTIL